MNRKQRRAEQRKSRGLRLSLDKRNAIVADARQLFQHFSPMMADHWGTCVYQTAALIAAAQQHGLTAENGTAIVPQAGSAFWRRIAEADDDGAQDTHWGFQYDPSTLAPGDMCGLPVEVHVWAAIPSLGEIIDISTRDWPKTCKASAGLDWPGPKPPDYMWLKTTQPPKGAAYIGDQDATERAHMAILDIWNHWNAGRQYVPERSQR